MRISALAFLFSCWAILFSQTAAASLGVVKLTNFEPIESTRWMFLSKAPDLKNKKLQPLKKLKEAELKKDWATCLKNVEPAVKTAPLLEPWIRLTSLRCLRAKEDYASLVKSFPKIESKNILWSGPWAPQLWDEYVQAHLDVINYDIKKNRVEAWALINKMLKNSDHLRKEDRAKFLYIASDLSVLEQKLPAARFLVEQSLKAFETSDARRRLETIVSLQKPDVEPSSTPSPKALNDLGIKIEASEAEIKTEQRMKDLIKAGQLLSAVEDGIVLLKDYPGGRRAQWASDRIIEIYNTLAPKSDFELIRERLLSQMEKAPAQTALDWAKTLYRNGDYVAAFFLAKKAAEDIQGGSELTTAVIIAGRSANFTGDYAQAIKFYRRLIEKHAGTPESMEALFRLGLVHYRNKDYSSAVAALEKILLMPQADKYDLSARYWLIRSLQQVNPNRAIQEIPSLITKYPFSYYGLRLKGESQKGVLDGLANEKQKLEESYWLLDSQKEIWQRFLTLTAAGWFEEANREALELPLPSDAKEKLLLARYFKESFNYPLVIRLVNEAGDQDPTLRQLDFISLGFPQEFSDVIEAQAKKNNLSPYLVKSLIRQESAFGLKAVSTSNAQGLMQMIPPTAQEIVTDLKLKDVSLPEDMYRPDLNITMGTYYLSKVLTQFKRNVPLGLAAYNAGPSRLSKWMGQRADTQNLAEKISSAPDDELWFDELPWSETSFYVKAILRNALLYQLIDQGRVELQPLIWQNLIIK